MSPLCGYRTGKSLLPARFDLQRWRPGVRLLLPARFDLQRWRPGVPSVTLIADPATADGSFWLIPAISRGRQQRPVYTPKQTSDGYMPVIGGKADIICRRGFGCF